MRIGFMVHDGQGQFGGVATWMLELLPRLQRRGLEPHVYGFTYPGERPLLASLESQGIPVATTEHAPTTRSLAQRAAWLCDRFERDRIQVVVPNYFRSGFLALRWLGWKRPRSIAVLHSDDPLYRMLVDTDRTNSRNFPIDAYVRFRGIWRITPERGSSQAV